jgi:hypothetical protein
MTDNKKTIGRQDRNRISVTEDYEVRDWADKFGVSLGELRNAVKEVGNNPRDVKDFFKKKK